jgi:hypothetical protein
MAARLPVIDSRMVPFEDVARLAVDGMAAVGEEATPPTLSCALFAALAVLADAYGAAGARCSNMPGPARPAAEE